MTQSRVDAANGALVLTGHDDAGALQRWSTRVVEPDSVVIRAEISKDNGNSWQPAGVSYVHRATAGASHGTRIHSLSEPSE
jgi:hypothetical protein